MKFLETERADCANARLPGDKLFWEAVLNQSDIFAFQTVLEGKGGPFGAQLWLVNPEKGDYVLVTGEGGCSEYCNAVLAKGMASAHAEAECLCPENRIAVTRFLEARKGEGWKVVQVSSGESCPSCRAKQVLFAEELTGKSLIQRGGFYVLFKATYRQTREIAGFNDEPYDQTFRAMAELGLLAKDEGLFALEEALNEYDGLVYNPVRKVKALEASSQVTNFLKKAGNIPAAVIMSGNGGILASATDERKNTDPVNLFEKSALFLALCKASCYQREVKGKQDSWNLDNAVLYTNVSEIGPLAYAESLWYNLSEINVAEEFVHSSIDDQAQELPGTTNRELFVKVAAEYSEKGSPLSVCYGGSPDRKNAAHLLWMAKLAENELLNEQAVRLLELKQKNFKKIALSDGGEKGLEEILNSDTQSILYNGKICKAD